MTDATTPAAPAATMAEALAYLKQYVEEQQRREAARWAALTPAQQIEELLARRTKALAKGLGDFAPLVPKLEGMTTSDFAWLLAGAAPNRSKQGGLFGTDVSAKQQAYQRVLDSCVELSLHPIPSLAPPLRFWPADLLRIAREKNLGDHEALARLIGPRATTPTVQPPEPKGLSAPPLPAPAAGNRAQAGISGKGFIATPRILSERSPEQMKKRRARQFSEFIKPYVDSAPVGSNGVRALSFQVRELHEKLSDLDVSWKRTSVKTVRRYVAEHRPLIELRSGRPRKEPAPENASNR